MGYQEERDALIKNLLDSVKQCQIRFGGRQELATDLDKRVVLLCKSLESIFTHGLKKSKNILHITKQVVSKSLKKRFSPDSSSECDESVTFWHFIRLFLNKHEFERYMILKNIVSEIGRGRAWLRSSLNENSLERYILMLFDDGLDLRKQFYEEWAFLRDEEKNSMLTTSIRGLNSILFAINIDNSDLDESRTPESRTMAINNKNEPSPVIMASSAQSEFTGLGSSKKRRGRCLPVVNVVSLDDELEEFDDAKSMYSASTAPPTCLSSPEDSKNDDEDRTGNTFHRAPSECFSEGNWSNANELDELEIAEGSEFLGPNILLTLITSDNLSAGSTVANSGDEGEGSNDPYKLSCYELKYAFSNVKQQNEELVEKTISLKDLLQKQIDENALIRAEMDECRRKSGETVKKLEFRNETLNKENDILKVQLKKYISAVQLLQPDERAVLYKERSNSNDFQSYIYYHESLEYEKKLVQVAEMHGELVEFNDRLQRVIMQKDGIINHLREELVELRGPLPEGIRGEDDDGLSVNSDVESISQSITSTINRPLINIWIPTAFLAGQQQKTSSSHHVYQVYVRIRDEEWNVYRRYSQFHQLHKRLKKKMIQVCALEFPPKKTIGNRDAKVVQERRKKLETYMRSVVNYLRSENEISDKSSLVAIFPFLGEKKINSKKSRCNENVSRSDTQLDATSQNGNNADSKQIQLEQNYIGL